MVKRLLAYFAAGVIAALGFIHVPYTHPVSDARATVYKMEFTADGTKHTYCSAVAIADHFAATAAHCVTNPAFWPRSPTVGGFSFETSRINELTDIAIIKIIDGTFPFYAQVLSHSPRPDTAAIAVGYPLNESIYLQVLTHGYVQGINKNYNNFLLATTPIAPGNSGGGLFVQDLIGNWKLAGIASAVAVVPLDAWGMQINLIPHLASFVPVEAIWSVVEPQL